jgi:paraquat-inducible protein B
VGSPVIFQGVEVGSVTGVSALLDYERNEVQVPVHVELISNRVQVRGHSDGRLIEREIERGLRARLKSQSLITGQLYVDLDYYPARPAKLTGRDPETPEIPTIPTEIQEIRSGLTALAEELRQLPLEDTVRDLASASRGLSRLLDKPELAHAIEELDATLVTAHRTVARIEASVTPITRTTQTALDEARGTLARIDDTVLQARDVLAPESAARDQMASTLEELERAARALRMLAESLKQEPDAILFGRGGEP